MRKRERQSGRKKRERVAHKEMNTQTSQAIEAIGPAIKKRYSVIMLQSRAQRERERERERKRESERERERLAGP